MTVCLLSDDIRYGFSLHSLLGATHPCAHFHLCRSEKETIQYLSGVGIYEKRERYPLPHVLLLDAHHPEGDDLFVLAWIRLHPQLNRMPIVLLVQTEECTRSQRAYDLGANACAVARGDLNALNEILDGIQDLRQILQYEDDPRQLAATD